MIFSNSFSLWIFFIHWLFFDWFSIRPTLDLTTIYGIFVGYVILHQVRNTIEKHMQIYETMSTKMPAKALNIDPKPIPKKNQDNERKMFPKLCKMDSKLHPKATQNVTKMNKE